MKKNNIGTFDVYATSVIEYVSVLIVAITAIICYIFAVRYDVSIGYIWSNLPNWWRHISFVGTILAIAMAALQQINIVCSQMKIMNKLLEKEEEE